MNADHVNWHDKTDEHLMDFSIRFAMAMGAYHSGEGYQCVIERSNTRPGLFKFNRQWQLMEIAG